MTSVCLTRRAFRDLQDIERYSVERWGKAVAKDYLYDIENGLNRLRESPKLLRTTDTSGSPGLPLPRSGRLRHALALECPLSPGSCC